ncbi:MAG TPA: GDP-mannose 4,6-dehydratase [bacterium]|nr:GDP-mannose 4,6-dehydratase [bacterium]
MRPSEVHELRGNIARARKKLGWQPKVKFEKLVRIMVESDLKELRKEHNL